MRRGLLETREKCLDDRSDEIVHLAHIRFGASGVSTRRLHEEAARVWPQALQLDKETSVLWRTAARHGEEDKGGRGRLEKEKRRKKGSGDMEGRHGRATDGKCAVCETCARLVRDLCETCVRLV